MPLHYIPTTQMNMYSLVLTYTVHISVFCVGSVVSAVYHRQTRRAWRGTGGARGAPGGGGHLAVRTRQQRTRPSLERKQIGVTMG